MNRLKDLRQDRDLSQEELGAAIGASAMAISYYEREERGMKPSDINFFCDYFGVTADYLLGRSNVPRAKWSKMDHDLIVAYRAAPVKIQKVVRELLELDAEAEADADAASVS